MNKIQRQEQVRARRLQQKQNEELNRALTMVRDASSNPEMDLNALCSSTSIRVLRHLAKAKMELPEGLNLVNRIHEAAQNEIVERTLLKTKGHG